MNDPTIKVHICIEKIGVEPTRFLFYEILMQYLDDILDTEVKLRYSCNDTNVTDMHSTFSTIRNFIS